MAQASRHARNRDRDRQPALGSLKQAAVRFHSRSGFSETGGEATFADRKNTTTHRIRVGLEFSLIRCLQ